ncbi:MAG: hypothetical protein VB137_15225 [Burkholderia sp.]
MKTPDSEYGRGFARFGCCEKAGMISAMATSRKRKRLSDAYRFEGFPPFKEIHGVFGDRVAPVIALVRRSKKCVGSGFLDTDLG